MWNPVRHAEMEVEGASGSGLDRASPEFYMQDEFAQDFLQQKSHSCKAPWLSQISSVFVQARRPSLQKNTGEPL